MVSPVMRHNGSVSGIRRASVPGGWLYQVASDIEGSEDEPLVAWHAPIYIAGIGSSDGGAV